MLLLGLGVVVGQLLTSFAIDAVWPAPASPGSLQAIAMVVVALLSVRRRDGAVAATSRR